ncbi:MAG: peptidoglycan DD-metalloendopeptidase family protein [bacterium]|nr:peptidoglycan DD-metalloendopeptidase family protein [bacterium]
MQKLTLNRRISTYFLVFSLLLGGCASGGSSKGSSGDSSAEDIANAILEGKIANIEEMEKATKGARKWSKQTFFHLAAKSGKTEIVRHLIESGDGGNINALDSRKNTPLHYAILNNYLDLAKLLIENGADVNAVNKAGKAPIHLAALSLPSFNSSIPSIAPVRGRYSSFYGIRHNPFSGKYQFHSGHDIAAPAGTRIKATASGKVIKYRWSGAYGKAILVQHGHGYITVYGHCSTFKAKRGQKVKRGEVIATVGDTGRATGDHVHYEVRFGGLPVNPVPYLNNKNYNKLKGYDFAAVLKLLLAKGVDINTKDRSGMAPLHYIVMRDLASTKLFISLGAKVNIRDSKGMTPLHYSVMNSISISRYLLRNKAAVNARTWATYRASGGKYFHKGTRPLNIVMKNEWLEMAKLLYRFGGRE